MKTVGLPKMGHLVSLMGHANGVVRGTVAEKGMNYSPMTVVTTSISLGQDGMVGAVLEMRA